MKDWEKERDNGRERRKEGGGGEWRMKQNVRLRYVREIRKGKVKRRRTSE